MKENHYTADQLKCVRCKVCGAEPGEGCTTFDGFSGLTTHGCRLMAIRRLSKPQRQELFRKNGL